MSPVTNELNPTILEGIREREAALNAALAAAQGEFPAIARARTAEVQTRTGGRYSYSYADLADVLHAVRPVLSKHGLAIVQILEPGPALRTELRHKDGAAVGDSFPLAWSQDGLPASDQALGSRLTYLRRYALCALLGVAGEEDDDARAAAPSNRAAAARDEPTEVIEQGEALSKEDMELVGKIQESFTRLRVLEEQLGWSVRDWTGWSRRAVGLRGSEPALPKHWREILPKLESEEARLVGELADIEARRQVELDEEREHKNEQAGLIREDEPA